MDIRELATKEQWQAAYQAFSSLRPNMSLETMLDSYQRCLNGGYKLIGVIDSGVVVCVAGVSIRPHIQYGMQLEIEDLSTHPDHLRKGYAAELVRWIFVYAKEHGCYRVKLDSGYSREAAHKLYNGLQMKNDGFRFIKEL